MNANQIVDELKKCLDNKRIFIEKSDLASYSYDASFGTFFPDVVVQPQSTAEVVNIVKFANQNNIPLYPRGSASSLSGGSLAIEGGIMMDFTNWDDLLEIYPDDLIAVVSPGVITQKINDAADRFGLMYPPDPSSQRISTIGGNIAENAGGPRCLKYGVTKDYVLGLEIVTANGDVINTGGATVKNVTGYDLTKLIVGSEGTLGIVTKAILQLIPKPKATKTAMVVFDDLIQSGHAITEIFKSGILPSKLEIMDSFCINAVEEYAKVGLNTKADAILLIELDGRASQLKEEMAEILSIFDKFPDAKITIAEDEAQANQLWEVRKLVSPAIIRYGRKKISEDATVPRSKIPQMFNEIKRIRDKYQINLVVFGHAGDGNLHPNILTDLASEDEKKRVEAAVEEIFDVTIKMGGTLSGEHGIGHLKKAFMEQELGFHGVEYMKEIKKALDPKGILNPGKMFPDKNERFSLHE
ncbi:FAD-binding oxidoreductase [Macrococcus animalis]|uniref:FAD-binding oxidoreductase n=1 Tax=Macrococcus animalis TaxID=3395467 RepID=UPI0039BE57EB